MCAGFARVRVRQLLTEFCTKSTKNLCAMPEKPDLFGPGLSGLGQEARNGQSHHVFGYR